MAQRNNLGLACYAAALACASLAAEVSRAQDTAQTQEQLRKLSQQNQALQEQLRQQQALIDSLSRKVNGLETANAQREREPATAETGRKEPSSGAASSGSFGLGKVNISGEGGLAFFNTGSEGFAPNAEFRVDEARLFVEAPVWDNVYFFSELNLATRELDGLELRLGELYLDFENVSRLWGRDRVLSVRAGRMDIPFGEEYQARDAIDNPLISHSLSDLWGVDEGVELYGRAGEFSYVVAAQNGGISGTRDFDSDKSVAGRLGFDPASWLHLSVSGMRTGDLDAQNDFLSELWFGNGLFRSLGSTNTTRFHANLVEGDVEVRLPRGHLKAFGGYVRYGDNDPSGNNRRHVYYYSVEGVHELGHKFYGGVRFSQIFANKGFPVVGHGEFDEYFFNELTKDLWRLSLGLGYRFSQNLVLKAEYAFERGEELIGDQREHEDLFALEAAFKF